MNRAAPDWRLPYATISAPILLTENSIREVVAHFCNPTVISGQSDGQDDRTTPCAAGSPELRDDCLGFMCFSAWQSCRSAGDDIADANMMKRVVRKQTSFFIAVQKLVQRSLSTLERPATVNFTGPNRAQNVEHGNLGNFEYVLPI